MDEEKCRRRGRKKALLRGEETRSERTIVLGSSISFVSAFGETSFIARLVLSPKRQAFLGPLYYATMFLREAPRTDSGKLISRKQTKI